MSYDLIVCCDVSNSHDAIVWSQLDDLLLEQGEGPAILHQIADLLMDKYPCEREGGDSNSDVFSSEPLSDCISKNALSLPMAFSRAKEVIPFVVETAHRLNLFVLDPQYEWIYRLDGIKQLNLTIENKPVFSSPTLMQMQDLVDALTPDGGPGFMIVEGYGDDYIQIAGGDGAFTCEWREYKGDSFRHFVGGLPDQSTEREVTIATNGAFVTVKENERLSALHVKEIIRAYADRAGLPTALQWREITNEFK